MNSPAPEAPRVNSKAQEDVIKYLNVSSTNRCVFLTGFFKARFVI